MLLTYKFTFYELMLFVVYAFGMFIFNDLHTHNAITTSMPPSKFVTDYGLSWLLLESKSVTFYVLFLLVPEGKSVTCYAFALAWRQEVSKMLQDSSTV